MINYATIGKIHDRNTEVNLAYDYKSLIVTSRPSTVERLKEIINPSIVDETVTEQPC